MDFFIFVLCFLGACMFVYGVIHWFTRGSKE
jgi:hypothetical protein